MPSHKKLLINVIAAIDGNMNVDIVGPRMSGRSTLAHGIHRHYKSLRRDVLVLSGKPMLRTSALAGAGMAGIRATTVLGVAEEVGARLGDGRGLVLVDDWDHLDSETWAAMLHAHERHSVPLVTIRGLDRRAAGPYAAPGVGPSRVFEVPPLTNASIATVIKRRFNFSLDPSALALVVAYSSGAPGIAIAAVSAAIDQGLLHVEGEWAVMRGQSLWSDGLATVAHSILSGIGEERRRTLEQLSVLGTATLPDAGAQLGQERLAALADVDLVHLERTQDGTPVVSIKSALLDEYLRRQQGQLRFQLQSWGLGGAEETAHPYPIPVLNSDTENALLSTTYVHYAHAVEAAGKQWKENPNLANAIRYIETVWATTADLEKLERAFAESGSLPGMAASVGRWGHLYFEYRTLIHGDVDRALARLDQVVTEFPATSGIRQVALVRARLFAGEDPQLETLPAKFDGLVPETEEAVDWSRFLAYVMTGRLAEARTIRPRLGDVATMNAEQFLTVGMFDIAEGDIEGAARRADERFTKARARREWQDLPQVMRVAGLAALLGYGAHRFQDQLVEYCNLGAPAPHVHAYQSVLSLWAAMSVWNPVTLPVQFSATDPARIETFMPASHPDWQRAYHLAESGNRDAGADILSALADRQWEKGHRLAASVAYMLAAYTDPTRARLQPLETRVRALGAPGLDSVCEFVGLLCRGMLDAAEERVNELEAGKMRPETRGHWLAIAHLWRQRGNQARAQTAERRAEESTQTIARPARKQIVMPAEFNAREQELIHYLAAGMTYREIAEVFGVSVRAIEGAGARAMKKANVNSKADLVAAAGIG